MLVVLLQMSYCQGPSFPEVHCVPSADQAAHDEDQHHQEEETQEP